MEALSLNGLTVGPNGRASFSGLSTGIDFRAAIEGIIAAKRIPIDTLETRITTNETKIADWKELQSRLTAVREALSKLRGAVSIDGSTDIFRAKKVFATTSRSDGKAPSAAANLIGAAVTNAAAAGSHTVEVRQIAQAHKIGSATFNSLSTDLGAALGLGSGTVSGSFDIEGRTLTVLSTDTLLDLRDRINNANTGANASGVTASIVTVSATQHHLVLTKDATGSAMVLGNETNGILADLGISADGGATFSNVLQTPQLARFTADGLLDPKRYESDAIASATALLNGVAQSASFPGSFNIVGTATRTINYDASDTLNSLASKINLETGATGVTATVVTESTGARLEFTSAANFTLTDTSGLLGDLGVDNKLVIERASNTVSDLFAGTTLTLFQAEQNTSVKIDVERDLAQVRTAIEGFIAAYNEIKSFVNQQTLVDRETGRKSADAGSLFGSAAVADIEAQLARIVGRGADGVSTEYTLLAQIGIDFVDNATVNDPLLEDTLEINSARLDEVLLNNIADVRRLFTFDFSSSNPNVVLLSYDGRTAYNAKGYRLNIGYDPIVEEVVNGTFDVNTAGWSSNNGALLTVNSQRLRVTNLLLADSSAQQIVNVEVGATYNVSALRTLVGGAVGNFEIRDATNAQILQHINQANISDTFVAPTSTVRIIMSPWSSTIGAAVEFDNVSITKVPDAVLDDANISDAINFVDNGTFATDTTNWTAASSAVLSIDAGKLDIENGAAQAGIARQTVTVEAGGTYRLRAERTITGGAVGSIEVRDASNGLVTSHINEAATDVTFVAPTDGLTINISTNSSSAGQSVQFDNIILERVDSTDNGTVTTEGQTVTVTDQSGAAGLKLFYNGTSSAAVDINYTVGLGAQMFFTLDEMLHTTTGVVQNEITALEDQNELSSARVTEMELRLDIKRQSLTEQFIRLETTLNSLERIRESIQQTFDALLAQRS